MACLARLRVAPARDRLLGAHELARMHLVSLPAIGSLRRFPPELQLYEVVAILADVAFVPGASERGPIIYLIRVGAARRARLSDAPVELVGSGIPSAVARSAARG